MAGAALADPLQDPLAQTPPTARTAQSSEVSLEQAVMIAQSRYQGRVVRAETRMRGGRRVHEIRILEEGEETRLRIVRIDPQTGRFLR